MRTNRPGLACRTCRRSASYVTETRKGSRSIIRWRRCTCGIRFRTIEIRVDEAPSDAFFDKFFSLELADEPRRSEKSALTPPSESGI